VPSHDDVDERGVFRLPHDARAGLDVAARDDEDIGEVDAVPRFRAERDSVNSRHEPARFAAARSSGAAKRAFPCFCFSSKQSCFIASL
jgi:hypothetical protein